jgi:hypothetical protein
MVGKISELYQKVHHLEKLLSLAKEKEELQ